MERLLFGSLYRSSIRGTLEFKITCNSNKFYYHLLVGNGSDISASEFYYENIDSKLVRVKGWMHEKIQSEKLCLLYEIDRILELNRDYLVESPFFSDREINFY